MASLHQFLYIYFYFSPPIPQEKNIHRAVVGIGPKIQKYRWQLEAIAGDNDSVFDVTSFADLHKSLRRLREVTCSEYLVLS